MFKKSLMALSVFLLVGCGSHNVYRQQTPKYKISDEETKKWIIEGNKFEQCLFPKEFEKQTLANLSQEELYLYNLFIWGKSLQNVMGDSIAQTIFSDDASKNYAFNTQAPRFNHSQKAEFSKQWCANEKKQYNSALKQLKIEIKKAKQAEIARQKQAEKERKAREAYLKTPAGQMELARLQQERQHQEMMALQRQQIAQQQAMQEQMLLQQSFNRLNQTIRSIGQLYTPPRSSTYNINVTPSWQPSFNSGYGPQWVPVPSAIH